MRQFEFEERVGMKVSEKEYESIENVYLFSDLDKDEFCKMWVKMNKSRVDRAKEDARKLHELEELKWMLAGIFHREMNYDAFAVNELSKKEISALEKVGIEVRPEGLRGQKNVCSIKYEIARFLGIA